MPANSAQAIWETALGSLQLEVNRHNFETWLKKTTGLELIENRITVGVPSAFVAECLDKRLSPVIQKTLFAITKRELQVVYEVHQPWADDRERFEPSHAGDRARGGRNRNPEADDGQRTPARSRLRAPAKGTPLNPSYTFETFIVGKSNRFAHAAAMAVAERPGMAYNPLFIHSGVGLGKTHLLHAIGHVATANGLECLYVSAEQFTNDFVTGLRENRAEEFRDRYRSADVLLVDDIQFIAGKEHSKESFFHTFNDLHAANKQIVISSDTRPKSIPLVEERLSSRFEGGLIADISLPELETRMAILEAKAASAGMKLETAVADFIARKVLRNVRELEGALNRLIAMARLTGRTIDMDLAQQAISEMPAAPVRRNAYSTGAIVGAVAAFYGLSLETLGGKSRTKDVAKARQIAAYLLREETSFSLADVGKLLGDRGHTTALRAHDKIAYEINVDSTLRQELSEIRSLLEHKPAAFG